MSAKPDGLLPLLHFLAGDLDEIGRAKPETVANVAKAAGFDRAPLATRIRDSVIARYRSDAKETGLRGNLEQFGVQALQELPGADLSRLSLIGVDLAHADLSATDLSYSDLSHANLQHVDLSRATLRKARMTGARLTRAQFDHADLGEADLSGAVIVGASFAGAALTGAIGLPASIAEAARIDPDVAALLRRIRPAAAQTALVAALDEAIDLVLIGELLDAEARLRDLTSSNPSSPELARSIELVRVVLLALQGDLVQAKERLTTLE
jgi:uncharacterized protein YjbI with pentapeptide repeats